MPDAESLRSDARRNRAALLDAAEEVFDEHGTEAATGLVAERAGVGNGTLFRHFPTKEALLAAVFERHIEAMMERAEARLDADDAGDAFFELLAEVAGGAERKNRYADALVAAGRSPRESVGANGARFRAALGTLLDLAQRAGAARTDVDLDVVLGVLVSASRVVPVTGGDRQRLVSVLLDGLRP